MTNCQCQIEMFDVQNNIVQLLGEGVDKIRSPPLFILRGRRHIYRGAKQIIGLLSPPGDDNVFVRSEAKAVIWSEIVYFEAQS